MVDSNQQQSVKDAVTIAQCCADHGVHWYEEPFPFWQLQFEDFVVKESQIHISQDEPGLGLRPSKGVRSALGF